MVSRQNAQVPVPGGEQRECARAGWCGASTRDTEGTWHPALTYQPYCPTCSGRIVTCLTELPPLYVLLTSGHPGLARRGGPKTRVPHGPRIPLSTAADALARETAAVLAGWAARIRAVPNLRLSAPQHPMRSPERVREDCRDIARHHGPLFALGGGWTTRLYDLPGDLGDGRPRDDNTLAWMRSGDVRGHLLNRMQGTCRKCGRPVTRSPVSGWWWAYDGRPAGFCDHDPGPVTAPAVPGPVPADLEDSIGEEEIVHIGDGWVKVMRRLGAVHAGAEILDLHWQARRLTGQVPAQPEALDGMPCRNCEDIALVRAELPCAPEDPERPPPFSRCLSCRDVMTREEYDGWADMYAAWTRGAGILTCRRCDLGLCERRAARPASGAPPRAVRCCWDACTCCAGQRRAA
jgi:hypothetical protein